MRTPRFFPAALTVAALTVLTAHAQPAYPVFSAGSAYLGADFGGDGRPDVAVVDLESGAYLIGYGLPGGGLQWTSSRPGGVAGVTGVSAGRVLDPARDALVLAGPDANRVLVIPCQDPVVNGVPREVFVGGIGPAHVAALDIGGGGNTAHHDLYVFTALNSPPSPRRRALVRSTGAAFSILSEAAETAEVLRAQPARLKNGVADVLGLLIATPGAGDEFRLVSLATGAPVNVATAAGVPDAAQVLNHRFSPAALFDFVFHATGAGSIHHRRVTEPVPGTFNLSAGANYPLGFNAEALFVIPTATGGRLLALRNGGATAVILNFDGASAPTVFQTLAAPAGERFGGAAPTADGFVAFSGADGRPAQFHRYQDAGGSYALAESGALDLLNRHAGGANIFLFQFEPFVAPAPNLVQRLSAGDWTSKPVIGGAPPQITVDVWTFQGTTQGLRNPAPRTVAPVTPPAAFGLVNQYHEAISVFSYLPPSGDEVADVTISPPPGPQAKAVQITLTASLAGATIFYRTDPAAAWTAYTAPFPLYFDTTVSFYAQQGGGSNRKSPVRHATYTFPADRWTLDSDNDGVPDFVELGLDANNNGTPDYRELGAGLDPVTNGKDADGDGFNDLEEIVAGTNPYLASSKPAGPRLDDGSGFDLYVTPRPLDGTLPGPALARTGVTVRAFTLAGDLLGSALTANLAQPGVLNPAARMLNLGADDRERLLALATDPHFPIQTAAADKNLGRELLALEPIPAQDAGLEVNFTPGPGTSAAQAAAWRTAAQAAAAARPRTRLITAIGPQDTLAALLTERKLELLLQARGLDPTNQLTLFPARAGDVDRYFPGIADLLALEQEAAGQPAYRLVSVQQGLLAALAGAGANLASLRALANDVYRVSSLSNNAAPGQYALPVEVLRQFIRTGAMPSNYLAATTLTPAQRAAASNAVVELMALDFARPKVNLNLTVLPSPMPEGCTVLSDGVQTWSLQFAGGGRFLFPDFDLLPGTMVAALGYADVDAAGCADRGLEVLAAAVTHVPPVMILDADGDLLPDNFECAFFGGLAEGPYGDKDGDGYSNLQEFLDGTDPNDKAIKGAGPPVVLLPPKLDLVLKPGAKLGLKWKFPAAYAGQFLFVVQAADTLDGGFSNVGLGPTYLGNDEFEVELPRPEGRTRFYRYYLKLR
jgi:hypothetical protein